MTTTATTARPRITSDNRDWISLKAAATALRAFQGQDGSIQDPAHHAAAREYTAAITEAVKSLAPAFPHDAAYLELLVKDFDRWADAGFGMPDFLDSLLAFQPQEHREDGLQHLVVFPMYTQNG